MSSTDHINQIPYDDMPWDPLDTDHPLLDVAQSVLDALLLDAANKNPDNAWEYTHDADGAQVYANTADDAFPNCVRSVADVDASAKDFFQIVANPSYRDRWDNIIEAVDQLEYIDIHHAVIHLKYQRVWPTTGRDFTYLRVLHRDPDTGALMVCGCSVDVQDCPETSSHVRGVLRPGGFHILPLSDTSCRVTYVANADPKGSIPTSLIKMSASKGASIISKVANVLDEEGKLNRPFPPST